MHNSNNHLFERICRAFEKAGKDELTISEFMDNATYSGFEPSVVLGQLENRADIVRIDQDLISLTKKGKEECKKGEWKHKEGGATHPI